jgi:hypothetical protein
VHEDVAVAGGCFGLLHAGDDAIGDVVDLLERVLGRCPMGRNEDRHAVVMIAVSNDDPAAPGISIEVDDVDAVHAGAVERGLEIAYPLRDEEWGVRRFMLREPGGTIVNVLSHRAD